MFLGLELNFVDLQLTKSFHHLKPIHVPGSIEKNATIYNLGLIHVA